MAWSKSGNIRGPKGEQGEGLGDLGEIASNPDFIISRDGEGLKRWSVTKLLDAAKAFIASTGINFTKPVTISGRAVATYATTGFGSVGVATADGTAERVTFSYDGDGPTVIAAVMGKPPASPDDYPVQPLGLGEDPAPVLAVTESHLYVFLPAGGWKRIPLESWT